MKFSITIEGKDYMVPDFYTVEHWTRMNQYNMQDRDEWMYIVATAIGAPLAGLKEQDPEMMEFMLSIVFTSLQVVGAELQFEIDEYKLLDLEKITIGKFIDLDVVAADRTTFDKLAAELYEMPIEKVRKLDVKRVFPAVQYYLKWRRSVYQSYKALFDYNEEESKEVDDTRLTPAHAWYETMMVLCGGNFTDIDYATRRPFREAFNFLAWKKTKMLQEKMEIINAQNKFKK